MKIKIIIAGLALCTIGVCSLNAQNTVTVDPPVSTNHVLTRNSTGNTVRAENTTNQTLTGNSTLEVTNREQRSKAATDGEQPAEVPTTIQRNKPE